MYKRQVLVCLATPIAILIGSGIAAVVPSVADSLNNSGAHGFSELLYGYSSCGGNNGSAFAGFNGNTVFLNISLGLVMLFARFLPIIGTLAIAGKMCIRDRVMGDWKYDDQDLERLSMIMTLHDIGFEKEEIETYMMLVIQGADTSDKRLRMLQKKRDSILDSIHFQEKKIIHLDYLRYEIQHKK